MTLQQFDLYYCALILAGLRLPTRNSATESKMGGPGPVAYFAIYLFYICSTIGAFNLDTKVPIVKTGPPNSYFGFSVAQHQQSDSNDQVSHV